MASETMENVDSQDISDLEAQHTIFFGASHEDVSYAKIFWNSLALQPPLESRLVCADISQRLKVAKDPLTKTALKPNALQNNDLFEKAQCAIEEDRRKYQDMAKRREQIMSLLKKQREERIKREMILCSVKPQLRCQSNRQDMDTFLPESEEDILSVRNLQ